MQLELKRLQHINFVVSDYPAAQSHFLTKFGAQHNWELEIPNRPDDVPSSLITLGPTLFEIFGPEPVARHDLGKILRAQGPGFVGIEWGIEDLQAAKQAFIDHGVRIRYEPKKRYYPGTWFVSEPADLFGFALECYIGTWYTSELPEGMKPVAPHEYWRDEHPLGIHEVRNFTVAVRDVDAAATRWQDLTGAAEINVGPSADSGVRFFEAANTAIGLVGASANSDVGEYVERRGESIYSVTFTVEDAGRVAEHLTAASVPVRRVNDAITVVPAESNHGVRLEFVSAGL
ncbi:VOC family protein [Mycobacterium sp. E2327]|uniref:VOC family protein n=1 Tax=Mycobacterium sp. E2327 TaxID=1834132 RepID=UPI000A7A0911|nr:VOC family protein [Mycobacterium sp. E2327]